MKEYFKNIIFVLNISCIVIPFTLNIYYLPRLNFAYALIFGFVNFICIILYIITLITYYYIEKDNWIFLRFRVLSITFLIVFISTFLLRVQHGLGDYFFVFMHYDKMEEIVKTIRKYNNNTYIDFEGIFSRTFNKIDNDETYYTKYAYGMKIEDYNIILKNKNDVGIYSIYLKDNYIFLLSGGFLDGIGFAYSENSNKPEKYLNSKITKWNHLFGNWYSWYSD